MRWTIAAACLGFWWPIAAAASSAPTATCPVGFVTFTTTHGSTCCPVGFTCLERGEAETIDLRLRAYERANRVFLPSCTVGPGIGGVIVQTAESDLRWRWVAQPVGLNCGLTIRLDRLFRRR